MAVYQGGEYKETNCPRIVLSCSFIPERTRGGWHTLVLPLSGVIIHIHMTKMVKALDISGNGAATAFYRRGNYNVAPCEVWVLRGTQR